MVKEVENVRVLFHYLKFFLSEKWKLTPESTKDNSLFQMLQLKYTDKYLHILQDNVKLLNLPQIFEYFHVKVLLTI